MLPPPIQLLGVTMHPWSMEDTVSEIASRMRRGLFTQHVVVNVAKLVTMQGNAMLHEAVTGCDIINIDGAGVVWGARFLGFDVPERVAGIDLFERLLGLAQRDAIPVYFLGATSEVVNRAVGVAKQKYPGLPIAGFRDGYFQGEEQEAQVVDDVKRSGARMLFVGISTPKKEQFTARWKQSLGVDFVMGVGGSFDVLANVTRRAPLWMQEMGLEWLYRLLQEPRRMWRRYLITNSQFAWLLIKEKLRLWRAGGKRRLNVPNG